MIFKLLPVQQKSVNCLSKFTCITNGIALKKESVLVGKFLEHLIVQRTCKKTKTFFDSDVSGRTVLVGTKIEVNPTPATSKSHDKSAVNSSSGFFYFDYNYCRLSSICFQTTFSKSSSKHAICLFSKPATCKATN